MLTVMKSVHLYTFDELSETAKDAAAQWKYETSFRDDFGEYVDMRLEDLFPSSKPQPLYDFGCTQGSGFDIVGTFDIVDLLKVAGYDPDDATEWVLNPWRDAYRRTRTDHYTYCKWPYETSNISDGELWSACADYGRETVRDIARYTPMSRIVADYRKLYADWND